MEVKNLNNILNKYFLDTQNFNSQTQQNNNNLIKLILLISIFVVIAIAFITFIIIKLKIKKIKKEIFNKELAQTKLNILELRGEELATAPLDLKKFFKIKIDDYDLENLINSTYLNKSEKNLLIGENIEYEYATMQYLAQGENSIISNNFDIKNWNNAVLEYPNYFNKKTHIINQTNELFNLIIAINSNLTNNQIFEKFFLNLNKNGLLIICQKNQSKTDLKQLISKLKYQNIRYEVSYVKNKFLYIVKD
ncbi:hypothetical protein VBM87_01920 [Mycoplasma sp. 744]|nr:hypothetical protein [Mycoplasma sp. 744]